MYLEDLLLAETRTSTGCKATSDLYLSDLLWAFALEEVRVATSGVLEMGGGCVELKPSGHAMKKVYMLGKKLEI